jgi:hypothetical protein
MTEVVIRNQELLDTLNSFVEEFYSREGHQRPDMWMSDEGDQGEYYTGEVYLRQDCLKRKIPIGAPEKHLGQPIKNMVRIDPSWADYMQRVKYDFASQLGAHTSALLNFYPPGGYVGWHTNWDANAYQILFTWSLDGNGYFRYYDKFKDEIVTIPDVPGWQCRHFYFGALEEPEHHCWHSAYTDCDRITLAYKFVNGTKANVEKDRQAVYLRDMLIEEIETP